MNIHSLTTRNQLKIRKTPRKKVETSTFLTKTKKMLLNASVIGIATKPNALATKTKSVI